VLGGVADAAADAMRDSTQLQDLIARVGGSSALGDAYLAAMTSISGLAASGYAIQATLRLRSEETALRSEPVLATAVGRLRWATSHLVFGGLGPAVALAAFGLTAGLTYGLSTGQVGDQLPRVLGAAMVQLPAVWALAAIAAALFGLLPRLTPTCWAALGACLLLGQLGAVLRLDHRLLDVSPFTHIPRLPGAELTATPLIWLLVGTAVLTAAGLAGFRRRDTPVP
jgi:ABC-2 type transport system permease protein